MAGSELISVCGCFGKISKVTLKISVKSGSRIVCIHFVVGGKGELLFFNFVPNQNVLFLYLQGN